MSKTAEAILTQFEALSSAEQWQVYESIARNLVPQEYGPLSDDDLTDIARQTFAMLDEEETRARPR